ncbi:hypothetical protein ACWDR7_13045, partial [Microbacterium sp. NPDC003461]
LELLSELPAIRRHLCLSFLPGNDRLQEVSHPMVSSDPTVMMWPAPPLSTLPAAGSPPLCTMF